MRIFPFNRILPVAGVAGVVVLGVMGPTLAQETFGYTTPGRPTNVFGASSDIDMLYDVIWWLTSLTFMAVLITMVVFLIKYRHRPGRRAVYIHGNNKLEWVWTLIPTIIMVLIVAFSQSIWAKHKSVGAMPTGGDTVEVRIVARQFQWFFHYSGQDGKFGKTSVLWRQDTGDPAEEMGLRRGYVEDFLSSEQIEAIENDVEMADQLGEDAHALDDVVTSVMCVPVGKKIHVTLTSKDVLHSFFLPYFRVKQDAVPGLVGHIWFQSDFTSAQIIGTEADGRPKPYDIICAELCGAQHYKMRGQMYVVDEPAYEDWLADNAPEIEDEDEDE